ncbi:hypothetical protein ACFQ51_50400 [Streptomyces kaempferi]
MPIGRPLGTTVAVVVTADGAEPRRAAAVNSCWAGRGWPPATWTGPS